MAQCSMRGPPRPSCTTSTTARRFSGCDDERKDAIVSDTHADADRGPASIIEYTLLIEGRCIPGEGERHTVLDKYSLLPYATLTTANPRQILRPVAAAQDPYRSGAHNPF